MSLLDALIGPPRNVGPSFRVHLEAAKEVREAETIQAVKIASTVLNDEIWLILDRSFIPHDGLACYYAEEIPLLRDKTPEELREIHKAKLAFPGARVIQEGAEPQKGNGR